jgi:hypothetical protein
MAGRVFYVGDDNCRQADWINGFARGLTGREAKTLPLGVIRLLSRFGDVLGFFGLRFPLYASRLANLTTSNPVPMGPILSLLGPPPHAQADAIRETAEWLKRRYRDEAKEGASPRP